jgi:hypothetical protein
MKKMYAAALLLIAACASKPAPTAAPSPVQAANDQFVATLMQSIAGHEDEPASAVFKNIRILKDVKAALFLRIMNGGYSRALGVTCTHCHVETDFASDDKRPKRAAREMAVMHRSINTQLREMQELQTEPGNRPINCRTCHRGLVIPER